MSDTEETPHTIEYYKSELVKKEEIIEKLVKEVDNLKNKQQEYNSKSNWEPREQELDNQLKELNKTIHNLIIENETLKLENKELLKQKELIVEEHEIVNVKNDRQNSQIELEKTESVKSDFEIELVIPEGIKTGNLQKQSQVFKMFDQRYFVLTKDQLHYYKSNNDPLSQKSIDISPDCKIKAIVGLTFEFETKTRTYKLIADSEEERDSWIKEINECISSSEKEQSITNEEATKLEVPKSENIIKQKLIIPEGIKTGNLQKQSHYLKTFDYRYFVLTKDQKLYYYRSSSDPSNQKSIDLSSECKVKIGEGTKFDLETETRTYRLIADSEEERDSWVKELVNSNVRVVPSEKIEEATQNIPDSEI